MSAAQSVILSDDVQRAVDDSDDLDEVFALLNVATDHYVQTGQPMTLEAAIAEVHRIAAQVEALE